MFKKKFLFIIVIVVMLITIFICVDYSRVEGGKDSLFTISVIKYKDGDTVEYWGVGYKVIRCADGESVHIGFYSLNITDVCNETKLSSPSDIPKVQSNTYDISSFKEINIDNFIDIYIKEEISIIFIGRSSCGPCKSYLQTLKQIQSEYNLEVYYLSLIGIDMTSENYRKILELDEYIEHNMGYTPMTLIVKNNQLLSGKVGNITYDMIITYFNEYGVINSN